MDIRRGYKLTHYEDVKCDSPPLPDLSEACLISKRTILRSERGSQGVRFNAGPGAPVSAGFRHSS